MRSFPCAVALGLFAASAFGADGADGWAFDAGADLRIRQEIMHNVPGLPGGGLLSTAPYGKTRNHVRFRPRVWAELRGGEHWRLYARVTDEFRWNIRPRNHSTTFPDEAILDNLYLDATGLFDGAFDFRIGRQDLYGLYGLDHVFVDGTPGDGSRTTYADVVRAAWHATDVSRLDVFALYDADRNNVRWGTQRGRLKSMSGLGGGADLEMDDWGWGAIWSSELHPVLPYRLFAMQKNTSSFHRRGEKHPRTQRNLFGAILSPRLTDELSLRLEGMGQVGENGRDESIAAWSAYAGADWKAVTEDEVRPFASLGAHVMSGDRDAAEQDGGRRAWDPMWARGVNDSELFLYGTHYGAAWWSNMMFLKATVGADLGRLHRVVASTGPMFAETKDGLGGGDGTYKGLLSQIRYDFPLIRADRGKGERFELFGHLLAEFFNPGDYFATDRPSWFVRWQVDFKF